MIRPLLAALALVVALPAHAAEVVLPDPVPSHWQDQARLFGDLAYVPPQRSAEVAAWERANADSLSPGFLFDLSTRLLDSNPAEALEWYAVAMMRGLYDANRCLDSTAQRALRGLARQSAAVARYGKSHPEEFAAAGRRALARPDLFRHKVPADWVCAQGLSGMGGQSAGVQPPATWPAVEAKIREDFTRQFDEMARR